MGDPSPILPPLLDVKQQMSQLRCDISTQVMRLHADPKLKIATDPAFLQLKTTARELQTRLSDLQDKTTSLELSKLALDLATANTVIDQLGTGSYSRKKAEWTVYTPTNEQEAATQKNLGMLGRHSVKWTTSQRVFTPLGKALSKIASSSSLLRRDFKSTEELGTRMGTVSKQITELSSTLDQIDLQAQLTSPQWTAAVRSDYLHKRSIVAGSLQWLKWQQATFKQIQDNAEAQKALQTEAEIHTLLKGIRPSNSGLQLSQALRLLTAAEVNLAKMPKDSPVYVMASQALKNASREISSAMKELERQPKAGKKIWDKLKQQPRKIRTSGWRNEGPALAREFSRQIALIRFAEMSGSAMTYASRTENMRTLKALWHGLSTDQQSDLKQIPGFGQLMYQYETDTQIPSDQFNHAAPALIARMRELGARDVDAFAKNPEDAELRAFEIPFRIALRSHDREAMQALIAQTNDPRILGQALKNLLRDLNPPLLPDAPSMQRLLSTLNGQTEAEAALVIFQWLNVAHSSITPTLKALLAFAKELGPAPKNQAVVLGSVIFPPFALEEQAAIHRERARLAELMITHVD